MKSSLNTQKSKGVVYVQGPAYYRSTAEVFLDYGFQITEDITQSDLVCLTGGEDINCKLYGEEPNGTYYWDDHRDRVDMKAAQYAFDNKKWLLGVCRGFQLINVMPFNGGKLVQNVDGHEGGYHSVYDRISEEQKEVISVHHQMIIPSKNCNVISAASVIHSDLYNEPEVAIWDTKCFGVQFHPEFGHKPSTDYFYELLDRYVTGV